jgi:hypothetical protein
VAAQKCVGPEWRQRYRNSRGRRDVRALRTQRHGFWLSSMGDILTIAGALGLVASTTAFAPSRRPAGAVIAPTTDR